MVKKVVLIVLGVVGILIGGFLALGGGVLVAITGGDGFFDTGQVTLATPTHALVSNPSALRTDSPLRGDSSTDIQYRIQLDSPTPVFIGVGPASAVDRYLEGVQVDEVTRLDFRPFRLETTRHEGERTPAAPAEQTFWIARASGTGPQTLLWNTRGGDYRFVLMSADGAADVETSATVGIHVPFLRGLGFGLLIAGIVCVLVGLALLIWGIRSKRRPPVPAYPGAFGQYPPGPGQYGYPQPQPGQYGSPYPPPYAYPQDQPTGPYGQAAPPGEVAGQYQTGPYGQAAPPAGYQTGPYGQAAPPGDVAGQYQTGPYGQTAPPAGAPAEAPNQYPTGPYGQAPQADAPPPSPPGDTPAQQSTAADERRPAQPAEPPPLPPPGAPDDTTTTDGTEEPRNNPA